MELSFKREIYLNTFSEIRDRCDHIYKLVNLNDRINKWDFDNTIFIKLQGAFGSKDRLKIEEGRAVYAISHDFDA